MMTENENFLIQGSKLEAYRGREEAVVVPAGVSAIGEGAFKACVSLKKVVLPPGLCCIMDEAFKGCRKLQEVEIPSGVFMIGNYAFHRCHALKKICLPASVEELGDCVFLYCDSLQEVQMPGVRRLGKQTFVNDVLLEKLEISKELEEDKICDVFTGCGRIAEISFADGEEYSFRVVEAALGKLPLPSLIQTIARDVLRMMELDGRCLVKFLTNLKHVEIPEGIERIGKSCFFDKRGILSIKLPVSLKEIESRAFRNCIGLEKVIFSGSQVKIHLDAFKNCTLLKSIQTGDGKIYTFHGIFHSSDAPELVQKIHQQVLGNFRISGGILLQYLGNESRVAVPEGITRIAEEAFAGNEAIDRVILPETLEEIGAEAFRDCLLLQNIIFPEHLKRIGEGAFEHCVKLIRISLPSGIVQVEKRVFRHCRSLKEVSFGEALKEIEEQAFYGCRSLKEVSFPESLVSLGEMAFYRCSRLGEVILPAGVKKVGSLAFCESGVRKAKICNCAKQYGSDIFSACKQLKTMVLAEGVEHIPDKLAFGCKNLKQVVLPKSLTSVGRNVWEETEFLENWKKKTRQHKEGEEQADRVFWDGQEMEGEVKIAEAVEIVAGGAFYGNSGVTKVYLPEKVKWVGKAAFKGCMALKQVFWPSEIRKIEPEVFSGCLHLKEVRAEGNCPAVSWEEIGERAFFGCRQLKEIDVQLTRAIGKEACSGCETAKFTGFSAESLCGTACFVGERAFEGTSILRRKTKEFVILGTNLISGEDCTGEVKLPEGMRKISPFAFSANCRIKKIVFPESLQEIGEGAFWGCKGLEEVTFLGKIDKIGTCAFEKCSALAEIRVHTERTGKGVFAYCTALRRAKIEGVRRLEERTFEGCAELEFCVADQAEEAGSFCFSGCQKLKGFSFSHLSYVGKYAFADCNGLRAAEFQDKTVLSSYAFRDCGNLTKVGLLGREGRIYLREYAFSGCTALNEVTVQKRKWEFLTYKDGLCEQIPEMARAVFCSAMSGFLVEDEEVLTGYCGNGRVVKIPQGIKKIQAEVFRDNVMLEEIDIPESVEEIGARAFHGTVWMERQRQKSPMVVVNHMLLDGSGCKGEVNVSEEIRMVCGWAFANGMNITRINILSERTRVKEYAFRNCIYLNEIGLPDGSVVRLEGIADRDKELPALAKQAVMDSLNCFKTDKNNVLVECTGNIALLKIAEGITAIGEGAFQDGNLLTEVTFPFSVKEMKKEAFAGCKWLKAVQGAYGVERIGSKAFSGCGALEKVELAAGFRQLGVRAFEHCTALKEIVLPEGIEEIPDKAFYRCHSLKKINLPSSLKRIGKEAFAFCKRLSLPVIPEGVLVEERAFVGCGSELAKKKKEEEIGRGMTEEEDALS